MGNLELDKVYNQDCLIGMQGIEADSVDLIVTDPPYLVGIEGGGAMNTIRMQQKLSCLKAGIDITQGYDIKAFSENVVRLQPNSINAYFFCNKRQIPEYMRVYVGELKCKFDIICWHKTNVMPTYSNKYLTDTEYCLYFHKGTGKTFPKCYEDARTYHISATNAKDKKKYGHPTIKPLDLIERLIRNSSSEGDVVLDPFIGSGTTAIAAMHLNRRYIGFELNEHYYNIACERIATEQNTPTLF